MPLPHVRLLLRDKSVLGQELLVLIPDTAYEQINLKLYQNPQDRKQHA